jgi:hypothetical protein
MAERAGAEYERDCDEVLVGCALDADAKEADAFGKLARYETKTASIQGLAGQFRYSREQRNFSVRTAEFFR